MPHEIAAVIVGVVTRLALSLLQRLQPKLRDFLLDLWRTRLQPDRKRREIERMICYCVRNHLITPTSGL